MSETIVQSLVRLSAPARGMRLWRNNVGALLDATGRPVRYGLGNDSKKLNEMLKSGDLIGWQRVTITPEMVGRVVALFVSVECKHEGWRYTGTGREPAQKAWADLVTREGGRGIFATGELDI